MAKYITLRCIDCKYEKAYAERFADGKKCPKCGSSLYVQKEKMYDTHDRPITTSELASAIAQWCRQEGYIRYCVGTNRISETKIVVEVSIGI